MKQRTYFIVYFTCSNQKESHSWCIIKTQYNFNNSTDLGDWVLERELMEKSAIILVNWKELDIVSETTKKIQIFLSTQDTAARANKVIKLIEQFDDTFKQNKGEHLKLAIMAGISDAYRDGCKQKEI